jgi:LL-diaminopimelate aminotransferase
MQFLETDRLKALPPYLFLEIDRKKRAAIAAGRDVINFGVGDPDRPTPKFIVDRMASAIHDPLHHRYPLAQGTATLRERIAAFFRRRYGVALDANREIHALIGSKEGLGHLPLAVVNPGERVLIPDPAYPVYNAATLFAGGVPHVMDLTDARAWLPDLSAIPADVAGSAVLMFINYPNNPLGAIAPLSFYEEVVAFARKHDILVAQDAAYNEMYFDPAERPPSILQVAGAKDVCVEFHSASKTFNMTGWRTGFVVGHRDVIDALAKVKANMDSGQFGAVQEATQAAFAGYDRPELEALRAMYAERMNVMSAGLREVGFAVNPPRATFYIWARVPAGYSSMDVVTRLLDEAYIVCVPGNGFGRNGEGYVRFAMTVEIERIREALGRMRTLKW